MYSCRVLAGAIGLLVFTDIEIVVLLYTMFEVVLITTRDASDCLAETTNPVPLSSLSTRYTMLLTKLYVVNCNPENMPTLIGFFILVIVNIMLLYVFILLLAINEDTFMRFAESTVNIQAGDKLVVQVSAGDGVVDIEKY